MTRKAVARIGLLSSLAIAALGLGVGITPAVAKTKKKTVTKTATFNQCANVASPITDPAIGIAPASAVIPVTVPNFKGGVQDGAVTSVTSVGLRITHTFAGDLQIVLISPGGKVLPLSLERGQRADGFGTGAGSCAGTLALFTNTGSPIAGANVGDTDDPLSGPFTPEQPLGALAAGPARGFWTLLVTDTAGGDEGTLQAFSLNFTYSYKAQVKVKKKTKK